MSDDQQKKIFEQGLAFFGAITASLSHEMNNVLAIVNELSGLQDDCLVAAEHGRPLDADKLRSTAVRIGEQVERGKAFVKQLNGFAHCVDQGGLTLDAGANLQAVISLSQRFARLRKVALECTLPAEHVELDGCPFDLQHLIYRGIEMALGSSPEGSMVNARLTAEGPGAAVTVRGADLVEIDDLLERRRRFFELLAGQLEVDVEIEMNAGAPLEIRMLVPPSIRRICHGEYGSK
jgi:hypothetical protein